MVPLRTSSQVGPFPFLGPGHWAQLPNPHLTPSDPSLTLHPCGLTTVSLSRATVLKSVPFTARTAKRGSRFFCDAAHHDESNC